MKSTASSAESRVDPSRKVLATVGLILLALLALAVWVWELGADRRAVQHLAPADRTALFERTRANVDALCRPDTDPSTERLCREQAKFLLLFDECDAACRDRVQTVLESPAR